MEDQLQFDRSGEINTYYSFFFTYNYTNTQAVTSYALPFAGFTFRPRLDDQEGILSNKKIFWDFGDGTIVQAVTARHAYKKPGTYRVTNYFYDKNGESYFNIYSSNVAVKNIIEDSITFENPTSGDIILTSSEISEPISIKSSVSYQTHLHKPPVTIVAFASAGNEIFNFFDTGLSTTRYGYLYPNSSFLKLETVGDVTEFNSITAFTPDYKKIYCRPKDNDIVICTENCPDAFLCGVSGTEDIYFRSDVESSQINLMFGAEPDSYYEHTNTSTVALSCSVEGQLTPFKLSVTSNGLDEEGDSDTVFNINKNKFSNTGISFVVKVKSEDNFSIKNIPQIENISLILTDLNNVIYPAVFESSSIDNGVKSTLGGFYRGLCFANLENLTENVFISASALIDGDIITGVSAPFNIYPSEKEFNISKRGEDIDFTAKFREISFQPLFSELNVLYDSYIKNIFGDITSEQTSLGKATYEKITNFVSNNSVIDFSNIDKLISIFNMLNIRGIQFSSNNFRFPAEVSRFVNLLSINKSKLFGFANKFDSDFRSYGYAASSIHGKNIGSELSIEGTLNADDIVVGLEKFSSRFKKLMPFIPLEVENSNIFRIVDYKDDWGWGLALPADGYGPEISKFYSFYRYIPGFENSNDNSVIDFDDVNTTITQNITSYKEWSEKDGIISNIVSNQFYKGLGLIK